MQLHLYMCRIIKSTNSRRASDPSYQYEVRESNFKKVRRGYLVLGNLVWCSDVLCVRPGPRGDLTVLR